MPQLRQRLPEAPEINFVRVGINRATTYTGLCSSHDNEIFRPIDVTSPDYTQEDHLFLLVYRAVLREYHTCLEGALRLWSGYQKRVEMGLSPQDEADHSGLLATSHLVNAYELHQYKETLDTSYRNGQWPVFQHSIVHLKHQKPTIAVSSLFSLDDIDIEQPPRVALSIYPSGRDVVAVFSTTEAGAHSAFSFLSRVFEASGDYQKYLLSKLVLQCCENFVMAPTHYDQLPDMTKNAIASFFMATWSRNMWDYEDQKLFLF